MLQEDIWKSHGFPPSVLQEGTHFQSHGRDGEDGPKKEWLHRAVCFSEISHFMIPSGFFKITMENHHD